VQPREPFLVEQDLVFVVELDDARRDDVAELSVLYFVGPGIELADDPR
jgi:hypothetical protein